MALSGAFWRFLGRLRHRYPTSETTYSDRPNCCVQSPKTWIERARYRCQWPAESPWNRRPSSCRLARAPLIAFKDAKGVKDCMGAARAIFANFPRSMCAGPIRREDVKECSRCACATFGLDMQPMATAAVQIRWSRCEQETIQTLRTLHEAGRFHLRRLHEDSEDCSLAACAIVAFFLQPS